MRYQQAALKRDHLKIQLQLVRAELTSDKLIFLVSIRMQVNISFTIKSRFIILNRLVFYENINIKTTNSSPQH